VPGLGRLGMELVDYRPERPRDVGRRSTRHPRLLLLLELGDQLVVLRELRILLCDELVLLDELCVLGGDLPFPRGQLLVVRDAERLQLPLEPGESVARSRLGLLPDVRDLGEELLE